MNEEAETEAEVGSCALLAFLMILVGALALNAWGAL